MRAETIHLNGHAFFVREWGHADAPVLLMLHGFPEYGGAWAGLAALLADTYRCIAPDLRGYGQSYAPSEVDAYRLPELIGDMVALIDRIGGPVTVVGHDWGAALAYGLAIARPDLVDRLVILNGVHPGPFQRALAAGGAQTDASQYMHALRREGAETAFGSDNFSKLRSLFADKMDMSWMTPEVAESYISEWSRPGRLTGMLNWYRATPIVVPAAGQSAQVPALSKETYRVRMPHLLIWGLRDTALLPEATRGLERYCDALTRIEIEDADHWIAHQRPDQVAGLIRGWLTTAP